MGPLLRIVARVAAGVLIGRGWVSLDTVDQVFNDPASDAAFEIIAGGIVWVGTEGFYLLAKRLGWRT
ncbi:hypothetical protein [Aquamicrobium terrae]|uniref:Uncharacterized protein n=1 Tax=Aquamicrobium terrae TaxID=1324945 RepID=A0ABV2MV48_9HYPH